MDDSRCMATYTVFLVPHSRDTSRQNSFSCHHLETRFTLRGRTVRAASFVPCVSIKNVRTFYESTTPPSSHDFLPLL